MHVVAADPKDQAVRIRAFDFLTEKTSQLGDVLPWSVLLDGFDFEGRRVPLTSQQGIFKPAVLPEIPLSIRTAPVEAGKPRPYDDGLDEHGLLSYRYRGTDPGHAENVGLRKAMQRGVALVYLFGVVKGQYMPVWPVYIVGDDPAALSFRVAIDDQRAVTLGQPDLDGAVIEGRRSYVTQMTLRRLHQAQFRERVLHAYRDACAVCRLRHRELLEAAHILPDKHPQGSPVVPNGLALCKLHHAAFDQHILGIRPDCVIEIRRDILEEVDGPMLRHGLQEIAGWQLQVPRQPAQRPRQEFLEERYELFRKAG